MRPLKAIGLLALSLALSAGSAVDALRAQQSQAEEPPPVNQSDHPILREFVWRPIGPASMSGRIDDIEAVEGNPSIIYLGFATGGLWKSTSKKSAQPIALAKRRNLYLGKGSGRIVFR